MENREPLRVLQINSGSRNFGGVSSLLYNVYSHIDRDRVQFDFLTPYFTTYGVHRDDIEAMGGRIYELGIDGNKLARKARLYPEIKGFLAAHPYRVVHINSGNFLFDLAAARAVRDAGVENIIVHSHSIEDPGSSAAKKAAVRLLKPVLERYLTARCACSMEAAKYLFVPGAVEAGGVTIVRNGIEVEKFRYDESVRAEVRRELGIVDKHVVGHVGRFSPGKNQKYLVDVLARLARRDPAAVLVLLGDGEEMERVRQRAEAQGVADRVLFLGTRTDIERYYQAFDAFVFPSVWEGLGMVLVEAQVSGLRCVASFRVPREADVTGNVTFLEIGEANVDQWADAVEGAFGGERVSRDREAVSAGYDINAVAAGLADQYLAMVK